MYNRTFQNKEGDVSNYIPEFQNVNPDNYALSVCTVDGQCFNIGNSNIKYLAREIAMPINYRLAYNEYDEIAIHKKIAREPKETGFDYLMLNSHGLPHNPLNGSGGLMMVSMLYSRLKLEERIQKIK